MVKGPSRVRKPGSSLLSGDNSGTSSCRPVFSSQGLAKSQECLHSFGFLHRVLAGPGIAFSFGKNNSRLPANRPAGPYSFAASLRQPDTPPTCKADFSRPALLPRFPSHRCRFLNGPSYQFGCAPFLLQVYLSPGSSFRRLVIFCPLENRYLFI